MKNGKTEFAISPQAFAILSVSGEPKTSSSSALDLMAEWGVAAGHEPNRFVPRDLPLWMRTSMLTESAGTFEVCTGFGSGIQTLHAGRIVSRRLAPAWVEYTGASDRFSELRFSVETSPLDPDVAPEPPEDLKPPIHIPCRLIRRQEDQPRVFFSQAMLQETANSLRLHGQFFPIFVRRLTPEERAEDPDHEYEIIDGERRWRSSALAGMSSLKAYVTDRRYTNLEAFIASFVMNYQAKPHSSYENVLAVHRMSGAGMPPIEIAKQTGMSLSTVVLYATLRNLDPSLLARMHPAIPEDEQVRLSWATQLAKVKSHDEQRRLLEQATKTAGSSRRQVTSLIKSAVRDGGTGGGKRSARPLLTLRASMPAIAHHVRAVASLREHVPTFLAEQTPDARRKLVRDLAAAKAALDEVSQYVESLASARKN